MLTRLARFRRELRRRVNSPGIIINESYGVEEPCPLHRRLGYELLQGTLAEIWDNELWERYGLACQFFRYGNAGVRRGGFLMRVTFNITVGPNQVTIRTSVHKDPEIYDLEKRVVNEEFSARGIFFPAGCYLEIKAGYPEFLRDRVFPTLEATGLLPRRVMEVTPADPPEGRGDEPSAPD